MKSIELFAGIGGITLAAEWAGIETVAFCEREPFCQKVLNKHWPSVPIFDDVCTLNKKKLEERGVDVGAVDIISGGYPCQPYSIAGKRKGAEDDRDLWPEMFRLIEEIRPTWVVGENVANFANMELDRTLFDLENIGYKCQSFIIPAAAVGARHRRERIFIIAYSDHKRCEKFNVSSKPKKQGFNRGESNAGHVANTIGLGLQETRAELETKGIAGFDWWATEPGLGRVANGIPNRVDRIRGLGNAVVPQQIYPILHYIKVINDMETKE